jgi:hypothetical protein
MTQGTIYPFHGNLAVFSPPFLPGCGSILDFNQCRISSNPNVAKFSSKTVTIQSITGSSAFKGKSVFHSKVLSCLPYCEITRQEIFWSSPLTQIVVSSEMIVLRVEGKYLDAVSCYGACLLVHICSDPSLCIRWIWIWMSL